MLAASDLSEADVLPILSTLHNHSADDFACRLLEILDERKLISSAGLQALAGIEEKQGRLKEARDVLEKDLQVEPPSAPLLVRLAKLAYQSGDLEGAVAYLAHARDLEPAKRCDSLLFWDRLRGSEITARGSGVPGQSRARWIPIIPYYNYALGAVLLQEKNADGRHSSLSEVSDCLSGRSTWQICFGCRVFRRLSTRSRARGI